MSEFEAKNSDLYRLAVTQGLTFETTLVGKYSQRIPADEARVDACVWLGLRIGWFKTTLATPGISTDDKLIAQRYLPYYETLWQSTLDRNWKPIRDEFLSEARRSMGQAAEKSALGFDEASVADEPEARSYINFAHSLDA